MIAPFFVTYDSEGDALYLYLMAQGVDVVRTEEFGDNRVVDFDSQDRVIGVELLGASRGTDLVGLPEAERLAEAIRGLPQLASA